MTTQITLTSPEPGRTSRGGVGPLAMLARRRAWRDRWLVAAAIGVVGLSAFLAYAGPRIVTGTLDDGAADAVRAQADRAQIDITVPMGNPGGDNLVSARGLPVGTLPDVAQSMIDALPPRTASVASTAWVGAVSTRFSLVEVLSRAEREAAEAEGRDPEPTPRADADLLVAAIPDASATVVEGDAPVFRAAQGPAVGVDAPEPEPLQVALTEQTLAALGLSIGDEVTVGRSSGSRVTLLVTGTVAIDDPTGAAAELAPGLFEQQTRPGATGVLRQVGTVLMPTDAAEAFTELAATPLVGDVRLAVDPEALTLDLSRTLPSELERLESHAEDLLPDKGVTPRVDSPIGEALKDYPTRARAALAQMSVLIAGVTAAAAAVIALMAQLLVAGRVRDIELERARGASIGTTMAALAIESVTVTAVGVGLGFATAALVTPGATPLDPLVGLVAAVSVVAPPLVGARIARASWSGRRVPANRRDRAKLAKVRAAQAATRDVLVVVIGGAAVWSLRGRGVLQTQTDGVDPFLAIAPSLLALAVALVVLRAYAIPQRVVQALARRSRGAAGLLTAARARERVAALPLVALALAIAVAASGALLSSTVTDGQERASWERIGADVRIDEAVDDAVVARWERDGLTVSRLLYAPHSTIALGSNLDAATVLGVDAHYGDIVRAAGLGDTDPLDALANAAADWTPGHPLPALASQEILDLDVYGRSDVFLGRTYINVDYAGPATTVPDGWTVGPYAVVPLEALLATETQEPVTWGTTLVVGPGAADAVAQAGIDPTLVHTRAAWLDASRGSALIGGVQRAMTWAVAAVAALAAVGLLVSVATGSRERSRAIALLRTQGVPTRFGWWLALTDLAPMIVAAAVAGAGAALLVVVLLSPALGLVILSGGVSDPATSIDPTHLVVGGAALATLLLAALVAEVAAQRRAKLSEVLRYGETR